MLHISGNGCFICTAELALHLSQALGILLPLEAVSGFHNKHTVAEPWMLDTAVRHVIEACYHCLAWNRLPPEIKTTSLTLGQFSGLC